jgi:hypothetical protein
MQRFVPNNWMARLTRSECDPLSLLTDSFLSIILQEPVIILQVKSSFNSSKNKASWAFCLEREKQICASQYSVLNSASMGHPICSPCPPTPSV